MIRLLRWHRLLFTLLMFGVALRAAECQYFAPTTAANSSFFHQLIEQSNRRDATFVEVTSAIEQHSNQFHQFNFKYQLPSEISAQDFFKVMLIKGQEAHRFVPPIANSRFIAPAHLGFTRQITIRDGGPVIQEHVLVSDSLHTIVFVEDWANVRGEIHEGTFAAINQLVYENGHWYFTGTYLYDTPPTEAAAMARCQMFKTTFDHMITFLQSGELDAAYNQLQSY